MKDIAVAIDGPAGSGKSTVARAIAKSLGLIYIDTGAMYRTVGYYCLENGLDTSRKETVVSALDKINIDVRPSEGSQSILLNGEDVTLKIRTEECGAAASHVAAMPEVRERLVDMQRKLAKGRSVVMDGRDIGTNVLPFAEVKIFLSAGSRVRAERRLNELKELGADGDIDIIEKEIKERDYLDMTRSVNPLKKAEDAIEVDTGGMTADEVVDKITGIINGVRLI